MRLKIQVDRESGAAYVAAIDPTTNEHRKSATVGKGQELEIDLGDTVVKAESIGFGDVVDSQSGDTVEQTPGGEAPQEPADKPGGGNEGSSNAGQDQGTTTDDVAGSGQQPEPGTPADQATDPDSPGEDAQAPTTSAASEKPLYLLDEGKVDGFTNSGFEPSGLETPEGKALYHYAGDTAGQSATGNADGVNVYADADDDGKPVQPVAEAGQEQQAGQSGDQSQQQGQAAQQA